jgi:uridine kinase
MSVYFVGISGGSASGKSELIKKIAEKYSKDKVCIVSQDDYYKDIEYQVKDNLGHYNFDLADAIDDEYLYNDLLKIRNNKSVEKLEYTFNNPNKKPALKVFRPAPIVIVEGLFVYFYPKIEALFNLKIFVSADEEIRKRRRWKRDAEERGIPKDVIKHQWNNHVTPAFIKYVQPFADKSDIIINNNNSLDKAIEVLYDHFDKILKNEL